MHYLEISGIECYAYHGCLEAEGKVGQKFSVDVEMEMDLSKAIESDELKFTADYVMIHNVVREEMAIRSNLIEHVAGRILKRMKMLVPDAKIVVKMHKFNPPVNGFISKATVSVRG